MRRNIQKSMRQLIILLPMIATGAAQDSVGDTVRVKVESFYQQLKDGDAAAFTGNFAIGFREFTPEGGLMTRPRTAETLERLANIMRNWKKSDWRFNETPRHVSIQVFGSTAVASFYAQGTVTNTEGETRLHMHRVTQVWSEIDGEWKLVNAHRSNLRSPAESE